MSQKNTILIVVDTSILLGGWNDPNTVILLEKFLKMGGFDTITSNKAKEAMKMLEKYHDKIALILLDSMMSGRSGYNVLEKIKNDVNPP